MAKFYVEVIGSLDQVLIGPFTSRKAAAKHATKIGRRFDASVQTHTEMKASAKEFGPLPLQAPSPSPSFNPPKPGEHFLHKRVLESNSLRPMEYVVTRVAMGTVYYKPVDGGHSEHVPVEDFYIKVVL